MLGRSPAWRAALRIARRDAWRNRGRNALVALLVAVPVAGVSLVDTVYRTDQLDGAERGSLELGTRVQARLSAFGSSDARGLAQTPDAQNWASLSELDGTTAGDDAEAAPVPLAEQERRLAALLPDGTSLLRGAEWFAAPRVRVEDRSVSLSWTEFPLADGRLEGMWTPIEGTAPDAPGEVAVADRAARETGLAVGDTVAVPEAARAAGAAPGVDRLTVTAVVRNRASPSTPALVGPPGTLLPPVEGLGSDTRVEWYAVGPAPITWDDVLRLNTAGVVVLSRAVLADPPAPDRVPFTDLSSNAFDTGTDTSGTTTAVAAAAVAIGLALLQIALLAGPALAVGARRNQRMLAVVVSTGGERKHARRVVLANGLVVGVVASAVAALVGAGAGAALCWWLIRRGDLTAPAPDVAALDLLGLVAVGGLTAVAAALVPARQAARVDVVAALTGRRPAEGVRRHVPILGVAAVAAGVVLAVVGARGNQALVVLAGLALAQVGLVATSGAVVAVAARAAGHFGLAGRMALRDAARQRGRTAPAVAAVMAAIAGGLAAVLFVAAQDAHDEASYTAQGAPGSVRVWLSTLDGSPRPAAEAAAVERTLAGALPLRDLDVLQVLGTADGPYLDYLLTPAPGQECPQSALDRTPTEQEQAAFDRDPRCTGPQGALVYGQDVVDDTGDSLAALVGTVPAADREALAAGRVLVTDSWLVWPDRTIRLQGTDENGEPSGRPLALPATVATGSVRYGALVVPSRHVPALETALGAVVGAGDLVATTTRLPTTEEEERAQAALDDLLLDAGEASLYVERGYVSDYGLGLLALLVTSLLITLVGSLTAVGLARAESRADASTLAAVGASPGLRRRLAGAQAAVVVGLGAVLGTASGTLAGWALVRLQTFGDSGWAFTVPWTYAGAIVLGVPAVAVALAYATTRSRIEVVRRPAF